MDEFFLIFPSFFYFFFFLCVSERWIGVERALRSEESEKDLDFPQRYGSFECRGRERGRFGDWGGEGCILTRGRGGASGFEPALGSDSA